MRKSFSIKLDIPKPCHEDWDKMTSNEKGRHCAMCNKTVVDFTNYTDKQLAEFFSKIKGSICGRLTNTQMQAQLVYAEPNRYSFLHKLLFGTAMTLSLTGSANGNYIPSAPQMQNPVSNNNAKPKHFNPTHYIEGTATDAESKEHLPNVRLAFLHNGHIIGEAKTDAKGHYKFHLDGIYLNKEITITRTYEHGYYKYFSQVVKVTHLPYHFDINLSPRGRVEVVGTRVPIVEPQIISHSGGCRTGDISSIVLRDIPTVYQPGFIDVNNPDTHTLHRGDMSNYGPHSLGLSQQ